MIAAQKSAVQAARAAGRLMHANWLKPKRVNAAEAHDVKLELDVRCQKLIEKMLRAGFPEVPLLGEEGDSGDVTAEYRWVVDPIDGTVNFVYGLPAYVVSVAVQIDGQSVAGAIANVVDGAVYSAARGHGAHVRRGAATAPLRCSQVNELSMSLVGTGFAYDPQLRQRQAQVLAVLLPQVRDIRRLGSAALDLCLVAAGRLDAYFEDNLNVWDWAAGALIAAEAGARVRVPSLEGSAGGRGLVVAAAPGVDDAFTGALNRAGGL